ncbi:MAG: NUDIX domain-containing protein [Pseudomonadota bacterium]|nr:MAG: NUDIX domain-containing protein [Pseudomonadota bacterium]
MTPHSAGILLFKFVDGQLHLMLAHPGGPFWANKDDGAWTMPKGLIEPDEDPLAAAQREFAEETGIAVDGAFIALGKRKQPSGKIVHAWALEHDLDVTKVASNVISIEWPRHSGRFIEIPEIDQARWFDIAEARVKIAKGQLPFIDALIAHLGRPKI